MRPLSTPLVTGLYIYDLNDYRQSVSLNFSYRTVISDFRHLFTPVSPVRSCFLAAPLMLRCIHRSVRNRRGTAVYQLVFDHIDVHLLGIGNFIEILAPGREAEPWHSSEISFMLNSNIYLASFIIPTLIFS